MIELFGEIFSDFYHEDDLEKKLKKARESLHQFIEGADLKGKSFLDAGCGGGLFSLAAGQLQATSITSFDNDEKMIGICENIKKQSPYSAHWQVMKGSILNKEFVESIGQFDYVYCWGVVHHTGDMWKALENIVRSVHVGGFIYLGIYNNASAFGVWDDRRFGSSAFWKKVKTFLSRRHRILKMLILKMSLFIYQIMSWSSFLLGDYKFKNFSERGMNESVALKDWLFGFPYEYASVDEVFDFMAKNNFNLRKIRSNIGLRTNHFLFQRVE